MGARLISELPAGVQLGGRRSKYSELITAIEENWESLVDGKQIQYSIPSLKARQLNNRLNSYLRYTRKNMNIPDNLRIVKSLDDRYVYITLEEIDPEEESQ